MSAALAGRRVWLFDLDGTLVDSGPAHAAAFREAIAEHAPERLGSFRYEAFAGVATGEVAARLTSDPEAAGRLAQHKQRLYREFVDAGKVAVFPGARRLLDRLNGTGRAVYLVTGGSRRSVERILSACGLRGSFRDVLTADEAPASKPDPRFYAHACALWSVSTAEAVAVEDSVHGVASAVGAGLVTLQTHVARAVPGAFAARDLHEILSLLELEVSKR